MTKDQLKQLKPGDKLLLEVTLDRFSDAGHVWVHITPVDNAWVPISRLFPHSEKVNLNPKIEK